MVRVSTAKHINGLAIHIQGTHLSFTFLWVISPKAKSPNSGP